LTIRANDGIGTGDSTQSLIDYPMSGKPHR
jgi:hypothetical protein